MIKFPVHVKKALSTLNRAGFAAYAVGGAVRDFCLGKAPSDWDIACSATPDEILSVFSDFRTIETGLKHGTVTVMIDGLPLEITSFRSDGIYTDNRHPDSVVFTEDLSVDLLRRDFTMNSMAAGLDGEIVDLFGARQDLKNRLIRCVGDPEARFREDALRILRGLRFASELGFSIETGTAASMRSCKFLLCNISAERVRDELTRILCGKFVRAVLLEFSDILSVPLPELTPLFEFEQFNPHHSLDVWQHTVEVVSRCDFDMRLRWAALLHDVGKPQCFKRDELGVGHFKGHAAVSAEIAKNILSRLKFSNTDKDFIVSLIKHHYPSPVLSKKSVRRALNKHGAEIFFALTRLILADNLGKHTSIHPNESDLKSDDAIRQHCDELAGIAKEIIDENLCFSLRDLAVNGNDLLDLGFRGSDIGAALNMLLNAVIDEQVENNRNELLNYFRNIYVGDDDKPLNL